MQAEATTSFVEFLLADLEEGNVTLWRVNIFEDLSFEEDRGMVEIGISLWDDELFGSLNSFKLILLRMMKIFSW